MINAAGREIPEIIKGITKVQPYAGAFALTPTGRLVGPKIRAGKPGSEKLLKSIDQAIEAEAQAQAICMQTEDFRRAYEAFAAKQKPVFQGD